MTCSYLISHFVTHTIRKEVPLTSKNPDPPRIYRISSSSCRCLYFFSYFPSQTHKASHSSKKDLIFASYASPSPSGVTVILSLLLISSCLSSCKKRTHVLVPSCFRKRIYSISLYFLTYDCRLTNLALPLSCFINRDMLVCQTKVFERFDRNGISAIVLLSLVSTGLSAPRQLPFLQAHGMLS